jgi:haloalkane dehalogenase
MSPIEGGCGASMRRRGGYCGSDRAISFGALQAREEVQVDSLPVIDEVLRTPDERFAAVPGFPYAPHYVQVGGLRIAYVDEGRADAAPVLLMHGEPTWSFLYRKMIPGLLAAGHRVVAPDLVGCGRSDKPRRTADYSYLRHVQWMCAWMRALDLRRATLFCQDWGSLIGLRMVTAEPDRFDRVAIANGGLPTGTGHIPAAFKLWRAFARWSPFFPVGRIVRAGCAQPLAPEAVDAYDAPFPSADYKACVRIFPSFVPTDADDPERARNEEAWRVLERWEKPFLTLFSDRDPITRGGDAIFQKRVPGARGQPHATTRGAGHFLQEDRGPELARALVDFIARTPAPRA